MHHPTPYAEVNEVLSEMVSGIKHILACSFIGAYLQGSFALGDFDENSDVDFIVAVEDELTEAQVDSLQAVHHDVFRMEQEWARHLEGSYFPRELLRKPPTRRDKLWYMDNGTDFLIRSDHCNTLIVRWIVREKGVILAGPSPDTLVDPITAEMLREDIYHEITMWGQHILDDPSRYSNYFYQTYIVLNFARMLHDLHRGYPGSKKEGAEWAKSTLDTRWHDLIDSTWDGRCDPASKVKQPADPDAYTRTLEFVRYIIQMAKAFNMGHGGY